MKFAHLGDLHLGMTMNHVNLVEDQKYILESILNLLQKEKPDAVLIAGDVYDKAVPGAEATTLLGDFLADLNAAGLPVFIIAGNHDSSERLSYASELLQKQNVYISGRFDGKMPHYTLRDDEGEVNIWLLPFLRPGHVNRYIEDEKDKVKDYTSAVRVAIEFSSVDWTARNVIISHQFVTGAFVHEEGSEQLMVGGTDQVSISAYEGFEYVALGHIHSFQKLKDHPAYYCGTPLKYSFSEEHDHKGVIFVELKEKGNVHVYQRELVPLHDMRTLKGKYEDILVQSKEDEHNMDYLRVILTDEDEVEDAVRHLRAVYPNVLRLEYDNARMRQMMEEMPVNDKELSPMEIFSLFFVERNGREMNEKEEAIAREMIVKLFDEEEGQ